MIRIIVAIIVYFLCIIILTLLNQYFNNGDSIEYIKMLLGAMMAYNIYQGIGD